MIDLDQARLESTQTLGVVLPASLARAVEERAKIELLAKSSWLRRVILAELKKGAPAPEAA